MTHYTSGVCRANGFVQALQRDSRFLEKGLQ
jgi:hypothetical protein